MARSATFKNLLANQECGRFAALIRSQELSEQGDAQWTSECDLQRAFGPSDWPDHPLPSDPAAKLLIPLLRPEPENKQ